MPTSQFIEEKNQALITWSIYSINLFLTFRTSEPWLYNAVWHTSCQENAQYLKAFWRLKLLTLPCKTIVLETSSCLVMLVQLLEVWARQLPIKFYPAFKVDACLSCHNKLKLSCAQVWRACECDPCQDASVCPLTLLYWYDSYTWSLDESYSKVADWQLIEEHLKGISPVNFFSSVFFNTWI